MANVSLWEGIAPDLTCRGMFGGRFQLRVIVQGLVAMLLGIRFGLRDAKQGKSPFVASIAEAKGSRWSILKQGLRDAIVPLCVAFVIDGILQRLILGRVRSLAAIAVGSLLVFLPFVILRGISNRLWRHGPAWNVPHAP